MKERLLQFLEHLNIGQTKFEKDLVLGNGLINNMKDNLSTKSIIKILSSYPELNILWLLTGQGEMITIKGSDEKKETDSPSSQSSTDNRKYLFQVYDDQRELVKANTIAEEANMIAKQNDALAAERSKILAETTAKMYDKLSVTVNAEKEIRSIESTKARVLQELLIELGVGVKWQSPEEGRAILHKRISDALLGETVSDTHNDSDN